MKKLFFIMLCLFAVSAIFAQVNKVEINFVYSIQKGFASNQFAVWIEDAQGKYIKTLYATKFTANGGWKRREHSLPLWVKQSSLAEMSKAQIDAITAPTPKAGKLDFTWDYTDSAGRKVADGEYKIFIEATLRNENHVIYTASINSAANNQQTAGNTIALEPQYFGSNTDDRGMISRVTVKY
jgi:hypothetical protein